MMSARQKMLEKDKAVSVDTVVCQDCREIPKSARLWIILNQYQASQKQTAFRSSIAHSDEVG